MSEQTKQLEVSAEARNATIQCTARMRSYFGAQPWLSEPGDDPAFGIVQRAIAEAEKAFVQKAGGTMEGVGMEIARLAKELAECHGERFSGNPSKWSHAAQIEGFRKQRDEAFDEKDKLASQLSELSTERAAKEAYQADATNERYQRYKELADSLILTQQKLQQSGVALSAESALHRAQYDNLHSQLQKAEADVKSARESRNRWETMCGQANTKRQQAEQERDEARAELSSIRADLAERDSLQKQNAEMLSEIADHSADRVQIMLSLEKAEARNAELVNALKEACDRLEWAIQTFSGRPFRSWNSSKEWLPYAERALTNGRKLNQSPE